MLIYLKYTIFGAMPWPCHAHATIYCFLFIFHFILITFIIGWPFTSACKCKHMLCNRTNRNVLNSSKIFLTLFSQASLNISDSIIKFCLQKKQKTRKGQWKPNSLFAFIIFYINEWSCSICCLLFSTILCILYHTG